MVRVLLLDTEAFAHAGQSNSIHGTSPELPYGSLPNGADGRDYFIQRTVIKHDHVLDRQMAWQDRLSQTFAQAAMGKAHTDPGLLSGSLPRTP